MFFSFNQPDYWQIGLQKPATYIMEQMMFFHDYINFHIIYIGIAVVFLLFVIIIKFNKKQFPKKNIKHFTHSSSLEIIWTLVPAIILVIIAVPSFKLLYILEEINNPLCVLKVIGHQWYWSYEFDGFLSSTVKEQNQNTTKYIIANLIDENKTINSLIEDNLSEETTVEADLETINDTGVVFLNNEKELKVTTLEIFQEETIKVKNILNVLINEQLINKTQNLINNYNDTFYLANPIVNGYSFDSYMISDDAIEPNLGHLRLLSTDNVVHLPINTEIKVLITSADVLHSWAIPAFGIKVDACPGRLSQVPLTIKRHGTFYGQCSEICGVNHGFMPITVAASLETSPLHGGACITTKEKDVPIMLNHKKSSAFLVSCEAKVPSFSAVDVAALSKASEREKKISLLLEKFQTRQSLKQRAGFFASQNQLLIKLISETGWYNPFRFKNLNDSLVKNNTEIKEIKNLIRKLNFDIMYSKDYLYIYFNKEKNNSLWNEFYTYFDLHQDLILRQKLNLDAKKTYEYYLGYSVYDDYNELCNIALECERLYENFNCIDLSKEYWNLNNNQFNYVDQWMARYYDFLSKLELLQKKIKFINENTEIKIEKNHKESQISWWYFESLFKNQKKDKTPEI